jgi:glycosyltransferase involved in cell wall biosynthesis
MHQTDRSVVFIHPEVRSTYQRGIYLYAKSLIAGVRAAGFGTAMLTDFTLHGSEPGARVRDLCQKIAKPPREKIRSLQMLPEFFRHMHDPDRGIEVFRTFHCMVFDEANDYLKDVQCLLNVERYYELCRLAASKPLLPAVDVDFVKRVNGKVAFTTAPVAIRSRTRAIKIVQTVHDLIVLNTDVHGTNVVKFRRRLEAALKHADLVVAVSDYTRAEILSRYPAMRERVKVVYQPIPANDAVVSLSKSPEIRSAVLDKYGLQSGKYVFYVGAIEERKNISCLIKAHQISICKGHIPLVLAGAVADGYAQKEGVSDLFFDEAGKPLGLRGSGDVRYLGRIPEVDKLSLLRDAGVFAFPTITEGFGIPALEAQSMGCPVIATNSSALPEVVGDTAVLLKDPTDVEELAAALNMVMDDAEFRSNLRNRGLVNSMRFTKERFSNDLENVLNLIA